MLNNVKRKAVYEAECRKMNKKGVYLHRKTDKSLQNSGKRFEIETKRVS